MNILIPTIETERLRLREWSPVDFKPYAALRTSAELMAYVIDGPKTQEEAWEEFCEIPVHWTIHGFGIFLVAARESDHAIGFAGLSLSSDLTEPELCWSLYPGHTGKGYATEAALAARNWATQSLGVPPLMSLVHPDNTASHGVAERLGATMETKITYRGSPRYRYRHRSVEIWRLP
ncbi:MAG: GNAT family N-acetyltransferase [Alphaproteobacteria bacterium]|nr:GNAT family N-acetyltransferase [Alphaproteobacteria bacterium]